MTVENQTVLKADAGKVLTNGNTYGKVVYLGKDDSAENWREITEEEYALLMADVGGDTE